MPVEATSLLDKFKNPTAVQTEQKPIEQPVKIEQKPDEVVISNKEAKDAKPKKTTAHYAGKGAGIGAIVGALIIPVAGLGLASYAKIVKKFPFEKFFNTISEGNGWKYVAGFMAATEVIGTYIGAATGALTGLIKNRKGNN